MSSFKIKLTLIFFCIAFVSAINKPDPENDRFTYKCLTDSVVVSFKQRSPYDVHLYSIYSDKDDSGCSRTFSQYELAVKELKFNPCGYAAKKFAVYVDEKYGRSENKHYFSVDCKNHEKDLAVLSFWDYIFKNILGFDDQE